MFNEAFTIINHCLTLHSTTVLHQSLLALQDGRVMEEEVEEGSRLHMLFNWTTFGSLLKKSISFYLSYNR